MQILRDQISSKKAFVFNNNISDMLEHIASTMDMIIELGETHYSLIKESFDSLLTAPNTTFHQCFQLDKMNWKGGTKMHNFDQLSTVAKSIYINMI